MNLRIFLLIFCFQKVTSQTARCEYSIDKDYVCKLTLNNPLGFDNLTEIGGQHLINKTDDDVIVVTTFETNSHSPNIPEIICDKFKNLEIVILLKMKLEKIDESFPQKCAKVNRSLSFSRNKLKNLPENLFAGQTKLKQLRLYDNQIEFLSDGILDFLIGLEFLSLNNNKMTDLPAGIFRNLTNLLELYLTKNKLSYLNPSWLKSLSKLRVLHLWGNQFKELPVHIFSPLINLEALSLCTNNLEVIHADSFEGNFKLKRFWFHTNKIDAIDERLLEITTISDIYGNDNPCVDRVGNFTDTSETKSEIKDALSRCFINYKNSNLVTNDRFQRLQIVSKNVRQENSQMKNEIEATKVERHQMIDDIAKLKRQIDELIKQNEIENTQIRNTKLSWKIETFNDENIEHDLKNLKEITEKLKVKNNALTKNIQKLQDDSEETKNDFYREINDLKHKNIDLRLELKTLADKNSEMRVSVEKLQSNEQKGLKDKFDALTNGYEQLYQQVVALKKCCP